jgi:AraC-like DNA-binding protein
MRKSEIFSKSDLQGILNITAMGHSADPEVTKYNHGRRWLYIIHYVTGGSGFFNGYPVKAGQGFLITPGSDEEYHSNPEDPWEFTWIISADDGIKELLPLYYADSKTGIFTYGDTSFVNKLSQKIDSFDGQFFTTLEMLEMYLAVVNNHRVTQRTTFTASAESYFDFSVNYIEANLHTCIKIKTLTDLLGITQVYLYKIFMSRVGKSPKQYIDDMKFTRAKKMLLETSAKISLIAESVGYEDPLTFTKFFVRKVGMSPQKYREIKNTPKN